MKPLEGYRAADTPRGRALIFFEIARLKNWALENEEPWGPRWTNEVVPDEPVEHEA